MILQGINIAIGVEVLPTPNSRRSVYDSETFTFYVKKTSLSAAGLVTC
jgi:hypothetical protein